MEAHVIAPGHMLVRARVPGEAGRSPEVDAFLGLLEEEIRENPHRLRPLTEEDVAGLDDLLEGVEYDKEEALEDEFELP